MQTYIKKHEKYINKPISSLKVLSLAPGVPLATAGGFPHRQVVRPGPGPASSELAQLQLPTEAWEQFSKCQWWPV